MHLIKLFVPSIIPLLISYLNEFSIYFIFSLYGFIAYFSFQCFQSITLYQTYVFLLNKNSIGKIPTNTIYNTTKIIVFVDTLFLAAL